MVFLKTLLIIVLIFYVLSLTARYILPYLLKWGVRRLQRQLEKQMGMQNPDQVVNKGDTTIIVKPTQPKPPTNNNHGEYTDFEEVKD